MKASVYCHRSMTQGTVSKNLFGGFVEHLGRCVYTGIYEPDHPQADAEGFREDTAALVKELQMPLTRYPGGNFVSSFHWQESIGPKDQRPTKVDYNWFAVEPNTVGINEFMHWCRKVNTEPVYTVNLGSGTPEEAMACVEYANGDGPAYWTEQRRKNGDEKPFGIHYWCLGNEMDGEWQVGHLNGEDYGKKAGTAAQMMKLVDPSIKVVLCGSSYFNCPAFGKFDMDALREAYSYVDCLAVHSYCGNRSNDLPAFLAAPERLDKHLETAMAFCDAVKAEKHSNKTLTISCDEWNVWYRTSCKRPAPGEAYEVGRHTLEEVYDMTDVLVVGGYLMSLMDHADRVELACLAQTVNVIAPIMTRAGGPAWRQTIFYPFAYTSRYGRGQVLKLGTEVPKYQLKGGEEISYLRSTVVYRPEDKEVVVFAINRSQDENMDLTVELGGFAPQEITEAIEIHNDDLNAVNSEEQELVAPASIEAKRHALQGNTLEVSLKPASWNMIRVKLA